MKNEGNARSDESKGRNRCGQGQTRAKHEWDGMSDGGDRDRPQMAGDVANDSQALTSDDITKYREHLLHESAICHKTNQISSLRQCKYAVRWQTRQRLTWNGLRGLTGISWGSREQSARSTGSRVVNLKRTRTQIGEATKSPGGRCQLK